MRGILGVAVLFLALVGCSKSDVPQQKIESRLRQWSHDFNDRNLSAACGLFADDVVLIYPGGPDRDRGQFCEQIRVLFADPAKRYTYAEPEIKEILVDGDLATVHLIWSLTVTDASGKTLETTREDGVDVFRRQADGSWQIHLSHAFPPLSQG